MARTNNKSKTAEASASESASVSTPVAAAAAPSTKVAKSKSAPVAPVAEASSSETKTAAEPKAKKSKAPKTEVAPVEVAPVVSAPIQVSITEEPTVAVEGETPLIEQSLEFLSKLQQISVLFSSIKTDYRVLEKKWTRELKAAQKQNSRRKRKSVNRAPSGFVKPTKISDELANFLGKDKGTEMARTSVTRDINAYIRANKLQDSENGRKINPDAKLSALLKLKTTDELTYFNLQKYMSPHFAKTVKAEVVEASA